MTPENGRELSDAAVALIGASLLFVLPVDLKRGTFAMNWESASQLPWGVLLLFGGGLSLAAAVQPTGFDHAIGNAIASIQRPHPVVAILIVAAAVSMMSEVTSNTALTSALLPVLGAAAAGLGVATPLLCITAALAASFAFMLPVGTPPNAIVFASGRVTIPQMAKAGLLLNLIGALLITAYVSFAGRWILGLPLATSV